MIKFSMTTTALVTTTLVIALGVYDLVVVAINPDTSISVSRFFANAGSVAPAIPFAIGFICGHLFGYMKPIGCEKCGNEFKKPDLKLVKPDE